MATHSSILAWEILWREETSELQPTGSQRVGHNWGRPCARARAHTHTHTHMCLSMQMFQEYLKNKAVKRWIHYFPRIHDSSLWALLYWIKSSSYQLCSPHRIFLLLLLLPYFPLTWPHPAGSLQWLTNPSSSIPINRTWVQGIVTSMTTSSYKEFPRLQSLALMSLPDVLQQHRSKLEILSHPLKCFTWHVIQRFSKLSPNPPIQPHLPYSLLFFFIPQDNFNQCPSTIIYIELNRWIKHG